jgi:AcrR family transcriptional regulator
VIEAALALADEEGLEAVTIRRLAEGLGVTPMALYWHVRNKDELLDGITARIFEAVDPAVDASATWQEQLRALLGSMLDALRAHPAAAILLATRTVSSEGSLRATDVMLDILGRGGFSPAEATQIARHALSTLVNLVGAEPGVVAREESEELAAARRRARRFLESLPPERYPRLVEAAAPLSEGVDPVVYFSFGLDLLLAGIEAMATRNR